MNSFSYGLVNSKTSVLLKDYSNEYYFVSDFWATTRYPRTKEGLKEAEKHIKDNELIDKSMERGKMPDGCYGLDGKCVNCNECHPCRCESEGEEE